MKKREGRAPLRELFIEELAEVAGGTDDPLARVKWWIREYLMQASTQACGEEGPGC